MTLDYAVVGSVVPPDTGATPGSVTERPPHISSFRLMSFTGMQYTVSWNHFAYSSFLTFLTATGGSRGGGGNPAMAPKAQEVFLPIALVFPLPSLLPPKSS